jgi:hypothetical protein
MSIEIDLVEANDADHAFGTGRVRIANGCAEVDMRGCAANSRRFRINDLCGVNPLPEEMDPAINLSQPPFAVLIVSVLTAVAIAGRPGHDLGDCRPLAREQEAQFVAQALQASGGDVVLCRCLARCCGRRTLRSGAQRTLLVPPSPVDGVGGQGDEVRRAWVLPVDCVTWLVKLPCSTSLSVMLSVRVPALAGDEPRSISRSWIVRP